MRRRKSIVIADSSATASTLGATWVELPVGISNLAVSVEMSGTKSNIAVYQSMVDQTTSYTNRFARNWTLVFSADKDNESATYHVMTNNQYPRFLKATTSLTLDCHYVVKAEFEAPV